MKVSPRLRPAPFGGLPLDVRWTWAERPADAAFGCARPDVPISRRPYGVVETDRDLAPDEIRHFDLTVIE